MAIKAVIFDLDGTITRPYLDFDQIRNEMGLEQDCGPLLEVMEQMPPKRRAQAEEILYKHEQAAIEHSSLNAGAAETLDKLRLGGIHIGVLTRNKRENALAVAMMHNLEFDAIVDRNDGPVKPDAFGVKHLCEHFKVAPSETLVVGDYLFDLLSATAAGAIAVLIKTHPDSDRFAEYADYTIENLTEILEIIRLKETE
jgi:HAD superfamily hydrolase (TIGR01509 family)